MYIIVIITMFNYPDYSRQEKLTDAIKLLILFQVNFPLFYHMLPLIGFFIGFVTYIILFIGVLIGYSATGEELPVQITLALVEAFCYPYLCFLRLFLAN